MEKKKLLLSSAGFCIVASYTIIKPLKIALFSRLIGASYLPWATCVSLLSIALCSILIAKLTKKYPITHLAIYTIYSYSVLLCINGLLSLLLDSTILSWIWYLCADLHTVCTLSLFWQVAHEYHSATQAQKNYHTYLAWGGIGSISAPAIIGLCHYTCYNTMLSNAVTMVIGALLLALAGCIIQQISYTPSYIDQPKQTIQKLSGSFRMKIIGYLIGLSVSYILTKHTIDLMLAQSLSSSSLDTYWTLLMLTSCTYATVTAFLLCKKNFSCSPQSLSFRLTITPLFLGLIFLILSQSMNTITLLIGSFCTHVLYNCISYPARKITFSLLDKTTRSYATTYSVFSRAIAKGSGAFLVMYGVLHPTNSHQTCIVLGLLLFSFGLLSWSKIYQSLQKMALNRQ